MINKIKKVEGMMAEVVLGVQQLRRRIQDYSEVGCCDMLTQLKAYFRIQYVTKLDVKHQQQLEYKVLLVRYGMRRVMPLIKLRTQN